ncbi:MAG: hypothetical protein K8R36_08240 [Planctomycetales bacterium]|nr:hypothetical protein [Planctomycetales bacterium]
MLAGWSWDAREAAAQIKARVMPSAVGGTTFQPERWGAIQLAFVNLDDRPAELMAASYFDDDPSLQFARRIWVPARSRLTVTQLLRVPALPEKGTRRSLSTVLVDPHQEQEFLVRSGVGELKQEFSLSITESPSTAIINVPEEYLVAGNSISLAYDLAVAAKSAENLGRRITQLNNSNLPATPEAYAGLDQLIVADNRLADDGPALAALRSWLFDGGHLWIMLDRIDSKVLAFLLGDDWTGEVVDRVELTSFRIEPTKRLQGSQAFAQEVDAPVSMVRLLANNIDVASTINGWPAAFWMQCGHGKLLVTTLAPEGWMQHKITATLAQPSSRSLGGRSGPGPGRPGGAIEPADPGKVSSPPTADAQEAALVDRIQPRTYVASPPMRNLAAEFFSARLPPVVQPTALEPHVQEYVGNSVPSRWLISGSLAGFGLLLVGLGGALWRINRLEWLGGVGPALAIGVSSLLMLLGLTQRRSIPSTVAIVQFIEPARGTNAIRVSGITDTYAPHATQTILASNGGGWIMPDRIGQQGQTTRMLWTGMGDWEWQRLPPSAGQRLADFALATSTEKRIQAQATFNSSGLTGKLDMGGLTHPTDAVLATQYGRMAADLNQDGSFHASRDFSGEQFIAADFLSDEQNRRSRTMSAVLSNPERSDFPLEPTLLVWTDPLDLGFQFDDDHRQLGTALVAIPLTLERPAPGSEVKIPSLFLPYRGVKGPDGVAPSGFYDYRRREWQDRSVPSSAWLRFQVPSVLLPLKPVSAKVIVQVAGPIGKLEIAAIRGQDTVVLKTWGDPVGTLSADINDPSLLQISDGGLVLKVSGGDPSRPSLTMSSGKANYWKIESLRLELTGTTAPLSPAVKP